MNIIIYGGNGWIGTQFVNIIKSDNETQNIYISNLRVDHTKALFEEIELLKPSHIISFIGRTHGDGINTIDYLEKAGKLKENLRDNLFGPMTLASICKDKNIHLTYIGTGCIFTSNDTSEVYNESDIPNFFGSSYSIVKGYTDRLMHDYENIVLNVRIRMPITDNLHNRNFITKIITYDKICSMDNSMSVLPTLLPLLFDMIKVRRTGTINLVNPGYINHNEILTMYKEIVDPSFTWQNFTIEQQNLLLTSKRSNCFLSSSKLESWYPNVPHIKIAVKDCLEKIAEEKKKSQKKFLWFF